MKTLIRNDSVTVQGDLGAVELRYKLELDTDLVRHMLGKAYRSKQGVSRDGALMLTILSRVGVASHLNTQAANTATP